MNLCKNTECQKPVINNKIYCNASCRTYYVNKYLRDYSKNKKGIEDKINAKVEEYNSNPNLCKQCSKPILVLSKSEFKITSEKQFCGHSCSAKFNNKLKRGLKYKLTQRGLKNLQESTRRLAFNNDLALIERANKYDLSPNKCNNCDKIFTYEQRRRKFCSRVCQKAKKYTQSTCKEIYILKSKFNFNLKDYPEEFEFSLIEKHGWYSPATSKNPNLGGVSRDHMISVMYGFNNNIDPKIISHPANCKLMVHGDNISKGKANSITLEQLIDRIDKWDKKYGLVAEKEMH